MAKATLLKNELASLVRMHPATLDRYLANLAKAGMLLRRPGGAAAHLEPAEYTNVLLALAAPVFAALSWLTERRRRN